MVICILFIVLIYLIINQLRNSRKGLFFLVSTQKKYLQVNVGIMEYNYSGIRTYKK